MSSNKTISIFATLSASAFAFPFLYATEKDISKPNIIFVLVDDMGWGDLNANWKYIKTRKRIQGFNTPSLDKMAEEGALLLRHYSACPVSAPARASLMTGVHQGHARQVRDNTFDTPIEKNWTLGSVLQAGGYKTAVIGKWGIGGLGDGSTGAVGFGRPRMRGFDYFYGIFDHLAGHFHYPANSGRFIWENEKDVTDFLKNGFAYSTDLFTARAKQWIIDHDKENPNQPFFLYLAYPAPHGSLRVPTCPYPQGGGINGGVQWVNNTVNTATVGTPDSFIHPDNKEFAKNAARRHATMIRRVDDGIGDIFELLKDLKIDDNTLVVFTSDNGAHNEAGADSRKTSFYKEGGPAQDPAFFKSYGEFDGIKRDCLEGGMRVPTIVYFPKKIKSGLVIETPSQFHDWMATLADVASLDVPSRSDGVSILPSLIKSAVPVVKNQIYCEYSVSSNTTTYSDFDSKHKNLSRKNQLVIWLDGYKGFARDLSEKNDIELEIYDTLKDPQELKNLAKTTSYFKELEKRMIQKVIRSRRPFDGKKYAKHFDFSNKTFLDKMFVPSVDIKNLQVGGLSWKIFERRDDFKYVPDLRQTMLPFKTSGVEKKDLFLQLDKSNNAKAALLEGFIKIETPGEYVFCLKTDKNLGSKAFVHLHDIQLIDADYDYKSGSRVDSYMNLGTENLEGTQKIRLEAGFHPIRIEYVASKKTKNTSLELEWILPGKSQPEIIPNTVFYVKK